MIILLLPTLRPTVLPWAGLFAFVVPAVPVFALLQLLWLSWKRSWTLLFPILLLLASVPVLKSTWGQGVQEASQNRNIRIISFNLRFFGALVPKDQRPLEKIERHMNEVAQLRSDILCLQEVYHKPGKNPLNFIQKLKKQGYSYCYFMEGMKNIDGVCCDMTGSLIASRYPIKAKGEINKAKNPGNRVVWADIEHPAGKIRVYNAHLISNSIQEKKVLKLRLSEEDRPQWYQVIRRLKERYLPRAQQAEALIEHASESKHPVVICGDFNELPYGYVYQLFRKKYLNGHEKAGRGFGFTYNGRFRFLRIDQIFFDLKLRPLQHIVDHRFKFSDHFPIGCTFEFSSAD